MSGKSRRMIAFILMMVSVLTLCGCNRQLSSGKRIVYGMIRQIEEEQGATYVTFQIAEGVYQGSLDYREYTHTLFMLNDYQSAGSKLQIMKLTEEQMRVQVSPDVKEELQPRLDTYKNSKYICEVRLDRNKITQLEYCFSMDYVKPSFETPVVGELNPMRMSEKLTLFGDNDDKAVVRFGSSNYNYHFLYSTSVGGFYESLYLSISEYDDVGEAEKVYAYVLRTDKDSDTKTILATTQDHYNIFLTQKSELYSLILGEISWTSQNECICYVESNAEYHMPAITYSYEYGHKDEYGTTTNVNEGGLSMGHHTNDTLYEAGVIDYYHHEIAFAAEGYRKYYRQYAFDEETGEVYEVNPGRLYVVTDSNYEYLLYNWEDSLNQNGNKDIYKEIVPAYISMQPNESILPYWDADDTTQPILHYWDADDTTRDMENTKSINLYDTQVRDKKSGEVDTVFPFILYGEVQLY